MMFETTQTRLCEAWQFTNDVIPGISGRTPNSNSVSAPRTNLANQ